ncbi:DUF2867 domain-containing protein [Acidobacteriota bacterium]
MKLPKLIKLTLAVIGAAICIVTAVVYWQYRAVNGPLDFVLIVLTLLGIAGMMAVILSERISSAVGTVVTWIVCGGLTALMFIGVMSIGPLVFFAALAFAGAALISIQMNIRKIFIALGVFLVSSLLFFSIFYLLVTNTGVENVKIPEEAFVDRIFSTIDYSDSFRIRVPEVENTKFDIVLVARVFVTALFPGWIDAPKKDEIQSFNFQTGESIGHWKVFHKSLNEIVLGFDRSYIDFRVSVLLSEKNGNRWLAVTTVIHYNNWKGRIYFIPVRFGHRIIFADTMRRVKEKLIEEK